MQIRDYTLNLSIDSTKSSSSKRAITCQKCARAAQSKLASTQATQSSNLNSINTNNTENVNYKYINLVSWYQCLRGEEHWMKLRKNLDDNQASYFINWINEKLENTIYASFFVSDLYNDLNDGLRILYLIEILYNVILIKEKFNFKLHKIKNFDTCLNYMNKERNIKCIGINSNDLADGNRKILLGLLFLIKHDYEYNFVKEQLLSIKTDFIKDLSNQQTETDNDSTSSDSVKSKSYSGSKSDFLTFENSFGYQLADNFLAKKRSSAASSISVDLKDISLRSVDRNSQTYDLINDLVHKNSKIDEMYNLHVKNSNRAKSDTNDVFEVSSISLYSDSKSSSSSSQVLNKNRFTSDQSAQLSFSSEKHRDNQSDEDLNLKLNSSCVLLSQSFNSNISISRQNFRESSEDLDFSGKINTMSHSDTIEDLAKILNLKESSIKADFFDADDFYWDQANDLDNLDTFRNNESNSSYEDGLQKSNYVDLESEFKNSYNQDHELNEVFLKNNSNNFLNILQDNYYLELENRLDKLDQDMNIEIESNTDCSEINYSNYEFVKDETTSLSDRSDYHMNPNEDNLDFEFENHNLIKEPCTTESFVVHEADQMFNEPENMEINFNVCPNIDEEIKNAIDDKEEIFILEYVVATEEDLTETGSALNEKIELERVEEDISNFYVINSEQEENKDHFKEIKDQNQIGGNLSSDLEESNLNSNDISIEKEKSTDNQETILIDCVEDLMKELIDCIEETVLAKIDSNQEFHQEKYQSSYQEVNDDLSTFCIDYQEVPEPKTSEDIRISILLDVYTKVEDNVNEVIEAENNDSSYSEWKNDNSNTFESNTSIKFPEEFESQKNVLLNESTEDKCKNPETSDANELLEVEENHELIASEPENVFKNSEKNSNAENFLSDKINQFKDLENTINSDLGKDRPTVEVASNVNELNLEQELEKQSSIELNQIIDTTDEPDTIEQMADENNNYYAVLSIDQSFDSEINQDIQEPISSNSIFVVDEDLILNQETSKMITSDPKNEIKNELILEIDNLIEPITNTLTNDHKVTLLDQIPNETAINISNKSLATESNEFIHNEITNDLNTQIDHERECLFQRSDDLDTLFLDAGRKNIDTIEKTKNGAELQQEIESIPHHNNLLKISYSEVVSKGVPHSETFKEQRDPPVVNFQVNKMVHKPQHKEEKTKIRTIEPKPSSSLFTFQKQTDISQKKTITKTIDNRVSESNKNVKDTKLENSKTNIKSLKCKYISEIDTNTETNKETKKTVSSKDMEKQIQPKSRKTVPISHKESNKKPDKSNNNPNNSAVITKPISDLKPSKLNRNKSTLIYPKNREQISSSRNYSKIFYSFLIVFSFSIILVWAINKGSFSFSEFLALINRNF